jgi:hypothetical protein
VLTSSRFSVGTGKPCVFETDTLSQFTAAVRESQETSRDERSTVIELDLYVALYKCVVQQTVQFDETNAHFQQWKAAHDERLYLFVINRHFSADIQQYSNMTPR